jgi:hypothetical protein
MDEKESDDDTSFSELWKQLPRVPSKSSGSPRKTKKFPGNDAFQEWLIGRYDRSSHERVGELISSAFSFISNHLLLCSLLYLPYLLITFFLFQRDCFNLLILFLSISSIFAFIVLFSFRKHIPVWSFFPQFISVSGFCIIFSELVLHAIHIHLVLAVRLRSSSSFFFLLIMIVWEGLFFFVPCLYFDNTCLGARKLVFFSVQISLLPGNPMNLISAILFSYLMVAVSPLTFGVTFWMAYAHRVILYYRVCGTNSARMQVEP